MQEKLVPAIGTAVEAPPATGRDPAKAPEILMEALTARAPAQTETYDNVPEYAPPGFAPRR